MRTLRSLAMLLVTALPMTSMAASQKKMVVERVVAVVNDSVILESELVARSRMDPSMAKLNEADAATRQARYRQVLRNTLQGMVDEELILQAAAEAKLDVTEAEVTKSVEEVQRQNKMTEEQFAAALAQQGYTLEQYRKDVRRQVLRLRAINVLVRPRVTVTDEEVKQRYDKLIGRSAAVTSVHLRHILIKLPQKPSPEEMEAGRRRAGELVARARGGEDFATLAKANSQDDASKAEGGDLGWMDRGSLPTEWEEIVFSMNDGDIRGPVRGPNGLHVFQVVETKKDQHRPFAEVKDQLRNQIFGEQMEKQTKVWLEELRKKANVEVKL